MPTLDDVRAIALSFPETIEKVDGHRGGAGWRTPDGLFVWERGPSKADLAALAALGRTWPDGPVVGVRTDGLEARRRCSARSRTRSSRSRTSTATRPCSCAST